MTINTNKGLFRFNRLPFGVSSAPAIFQRCMESLLSGMKSVSVYIDDIIVTGTSTEEHLENQDKVLGVLEAANLRLNNDKCFYLQPRVEYLGHVIDEHGLHPTEEKLSAIKEAPKPKNITELRAFLAITLSSCQTCLLHCPLSTFFFGRTTGGRGTKNKMKPFEQLSPLFKTVLY